jgi:hypothetical protein
MSLIKEVIGVGAKAERLLYRGRISVQYSKPRAERTVRQPTPPGWPSQRISATSGTRWIRIRAEAFSNRIEIYVAELFAPFAWLSLARLIPRPQLSFRLQPKRLPPCKIQHHTRKCDKIVDADDSNSKYTSPWPQFSRV